MPAVRRTASIDATGERALFDRYAGVARDAGRVTGAVTVLVTHRFASARAADLIVLADEGGVVETGTHRELIQARGAYAELYEIQARYFTKP